MALPKDEFDGFLANLRLAREITLNERIEHSETEWKFSLQDIRDVPVDYLEINENSVRLAIKNGLRDIPGLKIYKGQRRK